MKKDVVLEWFNHLVAPQFLALALYKVNLLTLEGT